MSEATATREPADGIGDPAEARTRRLMSDAEARYMRGAAEPHASSILTSTSKYLNNPYYRDTFTQFALRKAGDDVSPTYLIPRMVQALADVRDDAEFLGLVHAEKQANGAFAAWLERRTLTRHDPQALAHHAPGTLGALIRDFIVGSGMTLEFMKADLEPRTDVEYIVRRRAALHDIEHMVTGFGPNALGETALAVMNAVSYARYFSPRLSQYLSEANMFVAVTSLYRNTLHAPDITSTLFDVWEQAIAAGKAIRMPLVLVDWESKLHMTPDEIAGELGFARGPGDGWAWSDRVIHV